MKKFTLISLAILTGMLFLVSCQKPRENLTYLDVELGGCNIVQPPEQVDSRSYSEMKDDKVVIIISEGCVKVFVGLNYPCSTAPFTTQVEFKDNILCMYIIDTCPGPDYSCYRRCSCYYTFDFAFSYEREPNQRYKVVLIDPRRENVIVVSEGIIKANPDM